MENLIDTQKRIANELLFKLEADDPFAIIAGGAPRDWFLGREATDLDFYICIPTDITQSAFERQLFSLGIPNATYSRMSLEDARYIVNPLVRWVLNFEREGVKCQLIVMKESTLTSVVGYFPLSICMTWYKNGIIYEVDERDVFGLTVRKKAIVKTGTEYSSDGWYIGKILAKFPDFTYYESMLEFCDAHNLTLSSFGWNKTEYEASEKRRIALYEYHRQHRYDKGYNHKDLVILN
jgi:hypothetical protein